MIEWVLVLIGFAALVFGTVTDLKSREVPDWLNYAMMISGVGIHALVSLYSGNYWYILFSLVGLGVGFGLGAIMYYTGQWGGGDAKALGGLGALFGAYIPIVPIETYNHFFPAVIQPYNVGFLGVLVLNIFIAGSIYGIGWIAYLSITRFKKIITQFKVESKHLGKIRPVAYCVAVICIVFALFVKGSMYKMGFVVLGFLCIFMLVVHSYIRAVEKVAMIKTVPVSTITEGEWVVEDVFYGTGNSKKKICGKGELGLTIEQIALLKKHKVKSVVIKVGIPFIPAFLAGFVYTILWGSIVEFILIVL